MKRTLSALSAAVIGSLAAPVSVQAAEGDGVRRIEEVVVTAERQEASVSDTSISISALTSDFLEDFGIRNQSDLQNLIPATVIVPYDLSIRGIGRPFRALGGDPGVATYVNGVYSEDFYIASSGGLWDLERVEVLRGPQGTLYGRNAVGGAVNFINKRPTQEFEADFKTVFTNFDGFEIFGVVSGPLIKDKLAGRVTGYKRTRDGVIDEVGVGADGERIGPDLDSLGDENYTLQLEWTPTDNLAIHTRANERSVNRVIGGADGGGLVVFSEEGRGERNNFSPAFGFRQVDPATTTFTDSTFLDPSQEVFDFTNPTTGEVVQAQRLRGGLDPAFGGGTGRTNQAFGEDVTAANECVFFDKGNIDGDDLCAVTNGLNLERFDHQAVSVDTTWDLNDRHSFTYIFGYTDFFYDRITDDDNIASLQQDRQFYVSQEAEYVSHELQWFFTANDRLSFTTGLFAYDSKLTQRGDFYSSVGESRFLNGSPVGPVLGAPSATLFDGKTGVRPGGIPLPVTQEGQNPVLLFLGDFEGDVGTRIPSGPRTDATDLTYQTRTERESYAAYSQGVFDFNDKWSVTFGIRWAQDNIDGEENLFRYSENIVNAGAIGGGAALLATNIALGNIVGDPATGVPTLDANGSLQHTGVNTLTLGLPVSLSVFRQAERTDDDITWRLNFDYSPTDNSLIYFGATTGYRSGGFNLAFFSQSPTYEPEELIAYEIGYKGTLLDGTLQTNASIYYYDYENIHTVAFEAAATGGTTNSVVAAPGAEIFGIEADALWFVNDSLTLGGNFSFTPSEFTEDFFVINDFNPDAPQSVFTPEDRTININGATLPRVAEWKWTAWAQYGFNLGNRGKVDLNTTVSWIDDVPFTVFDDELDTAPSYFRWDARVSWVSSTGKYSATAFVNNILDEIGIRQIALDTEEAGYRRSGQTTEPRLFGLELQYKIGPEF